MSDKQIEVKIDKEGKLSIEAFGFNGVGCEESIRFLTNGLGQIKSVENKVEYGNKDNVNIVQDI